MPKRSSYLSREQTISRIALAITALLVSSCANEPGLRDISLQHDLQWEPVHARGFTLQGISRPLSAPVASLHIYIGGDGIPWRKKQPATNPTGPGHLALDLMLADPAPAIYLTRPCYQLVAMPPECQVDLWTSARYSDLVVQAMADAVTQLIDTFKPNSLTLIGYSGGGVLALLIAAQLDSQHDLQPDPQPDPKPRVITIASNLDTDAWTDFHGHLPLSQSSNPLLVVDKNNGAQHTHLIGGRDTIVPPSTIARYKAAHPLATYQYFEDFDHRCCWLEHWNEILQTTAFNDPSDT